jgi:hypothetical protein
MHLSFAAVNNCLLITCPGRVGSLTTGWQGVLLH